MKVLFIVNPRSGRRDSGNLEEIISEESRQAQFDFLIYRLQPDTEDEEIKKEIKEYCPDIVAAVGGDGTVNYLSSLLYSTGIPLLIIPLGSANGMAKELGIGRVDTALSLISRGIKKNIDILKINGKICIHLADIGLNARIVKRFEKDHKRGIITYAKYLFREIFLIKQYRFYIIEDGQEVFRKAVSLTFANASKYGTGAIINPIGKLDDGKFEIVIIKPFPRIKLLSIAWKMFRGTLKSSQYVEVISCRDACIKCSKKTTLQVDGEVVGKVREINIDILPGALTVIVPEDWTP